MATAHPRTTLKDLAQQAGVSITTASRALADNPAVAVRTRQKIQELAIEMGYRPNAQARALQSSRSNTIGVIVPSLINHYFAEMVTAIQVAATKAGIGVIISNTNEDPQVLNSSLDFLANQGVDGIICVAHEDCATHLETLYKQGTPLVLIDRELPASQIPTVISDPEPGMRAAISLLKPAEIGYLAGPQSTSTGRNRLAQFLEICRKQALQAQIYRGGFTQAEGFEGALELINKGITTLFAGDSMMTIGVIQACHQKQLVIGEDVSVIGFDTQPLFSLQQHPLTVIDQHVAEMAEKAFSLLLEDSPAALLNSIPTSLILGDSTFKKGHNHG